METDRHEERIQLLERDNMITQLAQAKIDGRLTAIENNITDVKRKLSEEISSSLEQLTSQMQDIIPQVTSVKAWGDIYKNLMMLAVGAIVTGFIGFLVHNVLPIVGH